MVTAISPAKTPLVFCFTLVPEGSYEDIWNLRAVMANLLELSMITKSWMWYMWYGNLWKVHHHCPRWSWTSLCALCFCKLHFIQLLSACFEEDLYLTVVFSCRRPEFMVEEDWWIWVKATQREIHGMSTSFSYCITKFSAFEWGYHSYLEFKNRDFAGRTRNQKGNWLFFIVLVSVVCRQHCLLVHYRTLWLWGCA